MSILISCMDGEEAPSSLGGTCIKSIHDIFHCIRLEVNNCHLPHACSFTSNELLSKFHAWHALIMASTNVTYEFQPCAGVHDIWCKPKATDEFDNGMISNGLVICITPLLPHIHNITIPLLLSTSIFTFLTWSLFCEKLFGCLLVSN